MFYNPKNMKTKGKKIDASIVCSRMILLGVFLALNSQLFCQVTEYKLSNALLDSLTIEYHSELNRNSVERNRSDESIIVITIEELSDTVVLKMKSIRDVMTILEKSSTLNMGYIISFYKVNELRCFIVMDKMKGIISNNNEALREFLRVNFYHAYKAIYEPKLDTLITSDGRVLIGYRYEGIVTLGKSYYWRVSICNGKVVKKSEIIG